MNTNHIVSAALASVLAMGLAGPVAAQDKAKEKCYGVSEAGKNDCASLSGSHSCAGQSKVSKNADEWKYVPKGTCKDLGGKTADEAKKK
jgi:uncharacterized membrane protein